MRKWPKPFMEPEQLRRNLIAMSTLDVILCSEDWLRRYQYNPQWEQDAELFSISNGAGDELYLVFAPEGIIIKGFDHESEMSPYAREDGEAWPGIYEQVPPALLARLNDDSLCKEDVTFCLWRECGDTVWNCGDVDSSGLNDGSSFLLGMIYEAAADYVDWAQDYYELELPEDAVEEIYNGAVVSEDLIRSINPERDVQATLKENQVLS